MLGHQARCNSLIAEVQSKHKSLYTNHRRLEEDITKMMGGDEFEHCKTIPCKQIRQTFDAADLELEALTQGLLAFDLKLPLKFKKKTQIENKEGKELESSSISRIRLQKSLSKSSDSLL